MKIKYLIVLLLCLPLFSLAQLTVAKIFSDDMLLQRNEPINIWGKAIPGNKVEVLFANEIGKAVAKADSTWIVVFNKQKANSNPQQISIMSADEKIEFKNILIGDVWLCIGQSNMEFPMQKERFYQEAITNSDQPLLRFYNPTYAGKNTYNLAFTDSIIQNLTAEKFYKGEWQTCNSHTFKTMSAVAYYFGKQIVQAENIPIGLINISIGGAPLETFINIETLKNNKQFAAKVNGDWLINDALPVWIRERGEQNVGGLTNVPKGEYGNNHAFKPGFAFQSGVEPILNMPIKGILCYQGESNAQEIERVNEYAALSALMVADYRKKWKQPQLPFYFVQLSSIDTQKYKGQLWPDFRDEQRKMIELIPHSAMAVSSDIGAKDDVHPTNKKLVGERLARWALNRTYHKNEITLGPLPLKAKFKNGEVVISFKYTEKAFKTADNKPLRGFSIDQKNEINAGIKNKQIVIAVKEKPEWVYYGWKPFSDANLINEDKIPVSTFKIRVK